MILRESSHDFPAQRPGKIKMSAKKSRSSAKISRSLLGRSGKISKRQNQTARGRPCSDPLVRANLEAFASIGLAPNDFVSQVCQMDHVSPDYIRVQKKRLEAERRYSHGLLPTVIRSHHYLLNRIQLCFITVGSSTLYWPNCPYLTEL